MEVIHGLESFPVQRVPLVLALGTFDGVHLGHQALIATARERARALSGRCAVLTFDPHPRMVLAPDAGPMLLTTLPERLALLAGLSVDLTLVLRFDDALRHMPAAHWVDRLARHVRMTEVVCGPNYSFGRDRSGNAGLLQALSMERGFHVRIVAPVEVDGAPVSSSRLRDVVRTGRVREAARLLGRWYAVPGTVVRGEARGRALGYPTANLESPAMKLVPGNGIYAAFARTAAAVHRAAVSIGTRPTFGPGAVRVEAYLMHYDGDLYGQPLELHFVDRLRDERAFPSVADLVRQMADDVAAVSRVLAEVSPVGPQASTHVRR